LTEINLTELYDTNENFKRYVDRYRVSKKKTTEDALKDAIVHYYAEYVLKTNICTINQF
jgi:hypothetical protein